MCKEALALVALSATLESHTALATFQQPSTFLSSPTSDQFDAYRTCRPYLAILLSVYSLEPRRIWRTFTNPVLPSRAPRLPSEWVPDGPRVTKKYKMESFRLYTAESGIDPIRHPVQLYAVFLSNSCHECHDTRQFQPCALACGPSTQAKNAQSLPLPTQLSRQGCRR